ncbi:MAG: aminopeptidase P family protein [Acidobacteriota bacterium]
MRSKCASLSLLAIVLWAATAHAGEFQDDLKARRARALERLGPDSMLVLYSAAARTYSRDIEYEYRQDSNLYYLTGIEQEETILVLMPGNAKSREILFVKARNPMREHWQGTLLSLEEATARSGIETVRLTGEFEAFIEAVLSGLPFSLSDETSADEYARFFSALSAGKAGLYLSGPEAGPEGPGTAAQRLAARAKDRVAGCAVHDAADLLRDLRVLKTQFERQVLQRSVQIAAEAQKAGMKAARPGAFEFSVKAAIEYVYRARGAYGWSYPPIVGSGPNATILHYGGSRRRMEAGDLLLVDAACNYEYLTGDITRTYPASGTFTEPQKDLYRIVLRAYDEGRKFAGAGVSLADIHKRIGEVMRQGLLEIGLVTDPSGDQYRLWMTHGTTHYVGMDVHDVGSNQKPLEPGMAYAMEPGIYIREAALEGLEKNAENAAFIAKVRPLVEKYRDIGIRIEDTFLMTEEGLQSLSDDVPRTIEAVEAFMRAPAAGREGPGRAPR